VRDFWRGEPGTVAELASRLTGSSDLYQADARRPVASINFVTAHDGFTMRDLVSYNEKHNEANGEDNNDGESHNRSWNCGAEGDTDDAGVLALRAAQQRNLLTTLLLSQGVPMLLGGDELGRTQHGNNNAYCQDNELSWFDWAHVDEELLEFTRQLVALRREHPTFRRRHYFQGRPIRGTVDLGWFRPDGSEMTDEDWEDGHSRMLGVYINGASITEVDERGRPVTDASFLLLLNAHDEAADWTLPSRWGPDWRVVISTADAKLTGEVVHEVHDKITVPARSTLVLSNDLESSST
jgi:glycogen operon protein